MATIKGFIFDLDGVLVDTARLHFEAWQQIAAKISLNLSEKQYEQMKGLGRERSLDRLLEWADQQPGEAEKQQLLEEKNEIYHHLLQQNENGKLLPGADAFLAATRHMNLRLALGSVSKNADLILRNLELTEKFDAIVDGLDIEQSKPHPEVFLKGAEQMGLQPEEVVAFDDSAAGIEAADRGGFRSVGIGPRKFLKKADLVFSGLDKTTPAEVINKLNF